jgi:hemerythrin
MNGVKTMNGKNKVIIYSSFILYMLDNLLIEQDQKKGSVIRLRQTLAAKTVSPKHKQIAELSNKVWADTIEKHKDKRTRIIVGDLIEMLVFTEEDAFIEMYGPNIMHLVGTVAVKIVDSGASKEVIKESREVAKTLIDLTRKYIFDNKDKL